MNTAAPVPQDVVDGLRRLRLATIREQAAEVLQTVRTQRWPHRFGDVAAQWRRVRLAAVR